MNEALIYRPNNRKLIWIAFACAITIHLAAVGFANSRPQKVSSVVSPFGPDIEVTDFPPSAQEEPDLTAPPEQPSSNEDFVEENATRPPIRPHKKAPVTAVSRANGIGMARATSFGSAKALTLYAPRPNYPYEARRGGVTGSGIAHLAVNSASGNVTDARMAQSTGSLVLDNATVDALRRWRFKPGVASNVDVPITYTLSGVSY